MTYTHRRPSADFHAPTDRTSLYEDITNKILAELEAGRLPWVQPWGSPGVSAPLGIPRNAATGRKYSSINVLILWGAVVQHGYAVQSWLTFRQALGLGGNVRKGERGTTVVYADRFVPDDERQRAHHEGEAPRAIPFLKRFTVFNVEQCEGLPEDAAANAPPVATDLILPQVEELIRATGADVRIGGDKAYYDVAGDFIRVPPPQAFFEPINWHRTALHEIGHLVGRRLGRDLSGAFGSKKYAYEEIVCELSTSFVCAALGIVPTVRHADYIGSWCEILQENNRAIVRAASAASKAADYYLSYLFRSINALIAGDLTAELGLSAADLGLLTSAYFLMFAAVQLPCGVLLDRYGPRLVDSALLLVAAAGSLLFALAGDVWTLMVGRALIGLGVAVGLMAGLKAIVLWFPPERVALVNGWYIMLGALGALSATGPAEILVQGVGWRGLFAILAASTAGVALLILLVVPENKPAQVAGSPPKISFFTIYRDTRFWRIAPLAATGVGTSFSLQGLWAAPWLTHVAGLERSAVVEHLVLMAAVLSASALLLGVLAERLRRAGISTETFLAGTLSLSMAAQLALLLGAPVSSQLLFAIIAAAGAAPVLSFAILARYFPKEVAGRANAALGVLNMGTAFGLQCLPGVIISLWPASEGHYPAEAHQAAMATGLGLQLIALGVFLTPRRRSRQMPMGVAVARVLGVDPTIRLAMPAHYGAALSAWRRDVVHTRRQANAWRFTAVASMALCAALCASLFVALIPASANATILGAAIPATAPTASLLGLLTMLAMLTGCLIVSDRRFAARTLRARNSRNLTVPQPAPRTAAAIQRSARPPDLPPSEEPTVRAHPWSRQEGVPRSDTPTAAPAALMSEASRRKDRRAGILTTGSAEPAPSETTAARSNGTIRLRHPRCATRPNRRIRCVANACGRFTPSDGTDTFIITRAQHGRAEPSAAQPRSGEGGPDSTAAGEQTVPAPRVHPASKPPTRAMMRVRRRRADLTPPDPIVTDNLGDPVPITAAEVDAIETYLGPKLRDLLASAASPRKDKD